MITYLDPVGEPTTAVLQYDLRADLTKSPLRLAVISNAFPDSDRFRTVLGQQLAERFPDAQVDLWEKLATQPYTDDHLAELRECDAVALLWGH